MAKIELVTQILAPRVRCFDLARSVDLHLRSTSNTGERAIAGVTRGLLGPGDEVTWQARHFGVRQRLTSKITAFDSPSFFQDTMMRGAFKRFVHDHVFEEAGAHTQMTDRLEFEAPFGPIGRFVDRWLLTGYLEGFLAERNALIKQVAESSDWKTYLACSEDK